MKLMERSHSGRKDRVDEAPSVDELARLGGRTFWGVWIIGAIMAVMALWRLYQQFFAWRHGMDSSAPDFARFWHSLLATNLTVISLLAFLLSLHLLRGCRTCREQRARYGAALPRHEASHIWRLWAVVAGEAVSFYGFSYFAEQDASWHQVAVRDTAFTPSHIILFQGIVPLGVTLAITLYLYGVTRLPRVYGRGIPLSLSLILLGWFVLFCMVAFNEFGHSFWIAEELFAAPLHYGFVLGVWLLLAAVALFVETLGRLLELRRTEQLFGPDGLTVLPAEAVSSVGS